MSEQEMLEMILEELIWQAVDDHEKHGKPQTTEMKAETFNGYASWNDWNVALWLNNEEKFYNIMCHYAELAAYMKISKAEALEGLIAALPSETPDGAQFIEESVKPMLHEQIEEFIKYS